MARDILSYGIGTLIAFTLFAALVFLFVRDITQKKHSVLRNYPVVGRLRYFFEQLGEYDPELIRVEPLGRYGEGVTVGMQVEEDSRLYTVTDVAGGSVVLDANHPLAGMALVFSVVILAIRGATEEEIERGVSLP